MGKRVSNSEANTFINKIGPLIKAEAEKRGYKVCSPVIAQACCESNFGFSGLSSGYHNYFGLKCGSSWKGKSVNMKTKEEYKPGILTTIKDNFRAYDSMEDGVKGYFDFISTKRYANLKTATTPQQYLEMIKADGYATSTKYVTTNMNYINKYNLERFDGKKVDVTPTPVEIPTKPVENNLYSVGKVYTLQANMFVRNEPNGEKVKFNKLTLNARLHGQADSEGNAVLKKGTKVTCKAIETPGAIWMQIPSGWVCAKAASGKVFIS